MKSILATEHGGNYLETPVHFNENEKSVDQLPVQQLMAKRL
ncbi:cyclase family protein [Rhodopirellula sp.]|nr:cyclase family protein [Rhodopirellula sp.]